MCSYLSRAQREDVAAWESRFWQRRDYCASWFSSQLLLTSFPGANDKYTLGRLLLNFTGRSHSSMLNRFPTCIPLQRMTGHLIYECCRLMVKKMVKSNQCADYTKFQKLCTTFKKCKRSIQALFSEASRISVNVSLLLQASIRFCEFGLWHNIKIWWQTSNRRTTASQSLVIVV